MESAVNLRPRAGSAIWLARAIAALVVLFMLFDVAGKYMMPAAVTDAFARQGMPLHFAPLIATLLLVLTVLYVVPRTRVLGAVLVTGYLGGACATNLRASFTPFEVLFPVVFGILMWVPVYMSDDRVRALLPLRRAGLTR